MLNSIMPETSAFAQHSAKKGLEEYKKDLCPHCGHMGWCYRLDELTVCQRDAKPAEGWHQTTKVDKDNKYFYAPNPPGKAPRAYGREEYIYTNNQGENLIKVVVQRPSRQLNRDKDVWQEYWGGTCWIEAKHFPKESKKQHQNQVTWYRYLEVVEAITQGKPIFIVEGEGVVDCLWKLGIAATTTIGGAGKYRVYGTNYRQDIGNVQQVILCPDRDTPGLKHMEDIFKDFPAAKWLYAPPSEFYWSHLPKSQGLDVKDWVMDGATEQDILAAIQERKIVTDSFEKLFEKEAERSQATKSKHEMNFNLIRATWGDKLRWNILKKCVELDGKKLRMDWIDLEVALACHIDMSKEQAKSIVLRLAFENPYNPVAEYLDSIKSLETDTSILENIAPRYFGTNDPLHAAIIKRTLIAAVARAYEPGCKHDNICILQGQQGAYKSTFWETLAGENFFTDDLGGSEKDEVMKLSQYWLLEYSEFETAYRKKEVAQLKAFLSRRSDSIRRPYASDIEDAPRPSIFVGTTNKDEFLHDPTGERRFWVIPVKFSKINIPQLVEERDLIWAAAVQAYQAGEKWHLNNEEEKWLRIANGEFQVSDTWEEAIASYLENRSIAVVSEILSEVLHVDIERRDAKAEMRVADCLRRLGWHKNPKQKRINGSVKRFWEPFGHPREDVTTHAALAEVTGKIQQDVTGQKVDSASNTAIVSLPSLPSRINLENIQHAVSSNFSDNSAGDLQEKSVTGVTVTGSVAEQRVDTVTVSVPISVTPGIVGNSLDFRADGLTAIHEDSGNQKQGGGNPVETVLATNRNVEVVSDSEEKLPQEEEKIKLSSDEFDAKASSSLMVECFGEENGGEMLLKLCERWSEEQKAEVRQCLTVSEVCRARQLMKDALSRSLAQPVISLLQPDLIKPGTKVKYVGDDEKLQAEYNDVELVIHSVIGGRQADCMIVRNGEIEGYTSWFFLGQCGDKCELIVVQE